jgi:hypothetical protein
MLHITIDCEGPRCGWTPSNEEIEGLVEKAQEPWGGLL